MSKFRLNLTLTVALVLGAGACALAQEAELIAVLKSGADVKAKSDACRELARVGTKQAVPALAALLSDEKLGHMARYALETIADPSVDATLRDALGKLKGRTLVGAIGSVGVRRDAQAVAALTGMLGDGDVEVARAAAGSLGDIASAEAAQALSAALGKAPADRLPAFCEGLLRCAEKLSAAGQRAQALAVYEQMRSLRAAPHQVRTAALRGAVLAPEGGNLKLLAAALSDKDYLLFSTAARTSMEMPAPAVTKLLAGGLGKLPPDRQILLVQTLGARGDGQAGPALMAAAQDGPVDVRIAAIRALTRLGHAPAVAVLNSLALSDDAKLAGEAQQCLANFPGKEGQTAVLALLDNKDAQARRLAVELIGRRPSAAAAGALLKAAEDSDADVRAASLKVLREVAGAEQLPALLRLLGGGKSSADVQGAAEALRALCAREATSIGGKIVIKKAVYGAMPNGPSADVTRKLAKLVKDGATSVDASNANFGDPANGSRKMLRVDYTVNDSPRSETVAENDTITFTAKVAPPEFVEAFCAALPKAPSEAKAALLGILRSAGGPAALKTVRGALDDSDADVKEAAFRALCGWPSSDALPALAELARSAKSPTQKVLALRGCIRLAAQQVASPAEVVASLKDALSLANRDDEKRLVLSALGNVPSPEALTLVAPFVQSPTLKEEACLAAVSIAEKLPAANAAQAAEVMQQVAKTTANKDLATRAAALARKAPRL